MAQTCQAKLQTSLFCTAERGRNSGRQWESTNSTRSAYAAPFSRAQLKINTHMGSKLQFQRGFSATTRHTSWGIPLRAAASTDLKAPSNVPVLDPQEVKEKRKFRHFTQPWFSRETVFREEAEGIWTLTQPFQLGLGRFADARLRSTVVRLDDGTLWVHGPVALTDECADLVQSIGGPVSHVVVPNTSPEHAWFSKGWAEKFPDAQWYAPVHIVEKLSQQLGRSVYGLENSQVPPAWSSTLQAVTFSTGANGDFQEDLFFHKREKALLVSDMLLCVDDDQLPTGVNKFIAQAIGVRNKLGVAPPFRLILGKYPVAAMAFFEALAKLDFSWIIFAHGSIPIKADIDDVKQVYKI